MLKKLLLFSPFFLSILSASADPVSSCTAMTVATNFYSHQMNVTTPGITLAYTALSDKALPLYYAFNLADEQGFVIVAADDAASPVIGYSSQWHFVEPLPGTNIYYWLEKEKTVINSLASSHAVAFKPIADEWDAYFYNKIPDNKTRRAMNAVGPLCSTTWDQPHPYNLLCPGGSVTGCVATAMAQILKYWNYPPHGMGSSYYYETSPENYGYLYANYDTANYVWSAMPNSVTTNNYEVGKVMYDCGVSVDMSYSPSASGAWVINADSKISAQNSYVKYFGYDPYSIQGVYRKNLSDSAWMATIENELNSGRVLQYAGWDSVEGGHTWVCDGYDVNNNLHMNWGWSGMDNGFYALDTLNPSPFYFSKNEELLYGIQPAQIKASFVASPLNGCAGITVNFTDRSFVSDTLAPITNWQWSFPGGYPSASNSPNPSVVYSTGGTFAVTLIVSNNLSSDTMTQTTYVTISGENALPLAQDFESSFPPAQWRINNPFGHSASWAQYAGAGGYGLSNNCIFYNNCSAGVKGQNDQVFTPSYDFSTAVNPFIYFDVAYTPYNNVYADTLAVYYSLDCGNTFTRVYTKGGMDLCTTGGVTLLAGANQNNQGCFVPLSNNWRTDTISIPAIAGQSNVMFSFENRSDYGSNMYIDNINIPVATGVKTVKGNNGVTIYPNPSNGIFNISFNGAEEGQYQLSVYNELGQQVISSTLQVQGDNIYPVNLANFARGIYSIVLRNGNKQTVQKVSVL